MMWRFILIACWIGAVISAELSTYSTSLYPTSTNSTSTYSTCPPGTSPTTTTPSPGVLQATTTTPPIPGYCHSGLTQYTGQRGVISSPGYPIAYQDYTRDTYPIPLNRISSVTLVFQPIFEFESGPDWVKINATGCGCNQTYYKYTGSIAPPTLTFLNCSSISIQFHTDSSVVRRGFSLEYTACTASATSSVVCPHGGCFGISQYTGQHGVISSRRHPAVYMGDANCFYSIELNQSSTISLVFQSIFDLVPDRDWIRINATRCGCTQLYQYESGQYLPPNLDFPNCSLISIQLRTSGSSTTSGFSLTYTTLPTSENTSNSCPQTVDCGVRHHSGQQGVISSPGYPILYPNNANCTYSIDLHDNESITLTFQSHFSFHSSSDWVQIDAASCGCNESYRYYGNVRPPVLKFNNCTRIDVLFHSDETYKQIGFRLFYEVHSMSMVPADSDVRCPTRNCGVNMYTDLRGVISSPGYPDNSARQADCRYYIKPPQPSAVTLTFESRLELKSCCDWIEIDASHCGCNDSYRYTGSIRPPPLTFTFCSQISIRFFSTGANAISGFSIHYAVDSVNKGFNQTSRREICHSSNDMIILGAVLGCFVLLFGVIIIVLSTQRKKHEQKPSSGAISDNSNTSAASRARGVANQQRSSASNTKKPVTNDYGGLGESKPKRRSKKYTAATPEDDPLYENNIEITSQPRSVCGNLPGLDDGSDENLYSNV